MNPEDIDRLIADHIPISIKDIETARFTLPIIVQLEGPQGTISISTLLLSRHSLTPAPSMFAVSFSPASFRYHL